MAEVTQTRMEKALYYLATTDEDLAGAKAERVKADRMLKTVLALSKRASNASTVADRETEALCSDTYQNAIEEEFKAIAAHELLMAKRSTEQTIIDVWRSLNASQRKSVI